MKVTFGATFETTLKLSLRFGGLRKEWNASVSSDTMLRCVSEKFCLLIIVFKYQHKKYELLNQMSCVFYGSRYIEGVPELQLQPGSGEWRASATELFYAPTTANELSVAMVEVPLVGTLLNICECCCN